MPEKMREGFISPKENKERGEIQKIDLEDEVQGLEYCQRRLDHLDPTIAKWEVPGNYYATRDEYKKAVINAQKDLYDKVPVWIKEKYNNDQSKVVGYIMGLVNSGRDRFKEVRWVLSNCLGPQGETCEEFRFSLPENEPVDTEVIDGLKKWDDWKEKTAKLAYYTEKANLGCLSRSITPAEKAELEHSRTEQLGEIVRLTNEMKDVLYLPNVEETTRRGY